MKNKSRYTALPPDFFASMPGVYIYGNCEVIIDGKTEICTYSGEKIIFDIFYRRLLLVIEGKDLSVRCAGNEVSEITGKIYSVRYVKRGSENDISY